MANDYYDHGTFPSTGSALSSAAMRAELELIEQGFDRLPALAGNAGKFVKVSPSGTAMTVDADVATNTALTAHTSNTSNPHAVTKAQVGLGNVDNTSDADKPVSTATQTALNGKVNTTDPRLTDSRTPTGGAGGVLSGTYPNPGFAVDMATQAELDAHANNTSNPHSVTKAQVGLGNVDNTSDADKPVSTATQTALNGKQDTLVSGTNIKTLNGTSLLGGGNITIAAGSGTVTSVAATVPNFLSVSGSPITASGTLAISYSGTALPVANGGTGATTLTGILKGNGTSAFTAAAAGTDYVTPAGTETLTNKTLTTPVLSGTASGTTAGRLGYGSGVLTYGDGTSQNEIGFRNIPQNSQSAAYTLVLSDSGKHILHPSADTTARTFTIPANSSVAYPIGTAITFVNQNGAGTVTIAITTDTMRLAGAGTTGSRTLAANGVATAIKVTSTEWIISGTNLT